MERNVAACELKLAPNVAVSGSLYCSSFDHCSVLGGNKLKN